MSGNLKIIVSLLGIGVAFSSSAAVAAQGRWVIVSRLTTEAKTPADILALQQKFPQLLGNIDVATTTYVSVDEENAEYRGPTVCPVGDSRLKETLYGVEICTAQDAQSPSQCSASAISISNVDPCAP